MLLRRHLGYDVVRQSGSHLRLVTKVGGEHHVTIPAGGPLRVGSPACRLRQRSAPRLGPQRHCAGEQVHGGEGGI